MIEMIVNLVIFPLVLGSVSALLSIRVNASGSETDAPYCVAITTLAVVGAFLGAYSSLRGMPGFPPNSATETLFYAPLVAGVVFVLIVFLKRLSDKNALLLAGALGVMGVVGVGWREFGRLDLENLTALGLALAAVAIACFASLSVLSVLGSAPHRSSVSPFMRGCFGLSCLGLGVVLILGGTATTGFFMIASAVVIGTSALFEAKFSHTGAGAGLAAGALLLLGPVYGQAMLYTDIAPIALGLTALSPLGLLVLKRFSERFMPIEPSGFLACLKISVISALACALPLIAAIAVLLSTGGDDYGY